MKTQIIRLEANDDVVSTRDKMGWGQTARILLVWPPKGKILSRRLDLILIQRHSAALGAQVALVTRDPDVRFHAQQAGIPVYRKLKQAQNIHWRLPKHIRRSRPIRPIENLCESGLQRAQILQEARPEIQALKLSLPARLVIFTSGVLAVLVLAAVLLPGAELNLTPKTVRQEMVLHLTADPRADVFNLAGVVPARQSQVTVEGREQMLVTGSTIIPTKTATGRVRFTNLGNETVAVPEGTVIRTAEGTPVRFATIQGGTVPAGAGRTLLLPVRAVQPGKSGNLAANSLAAIEGPLGTRLSASNPYATTGGAERITQAPSQEDRDQLKENLLASLRQTALSELKANLQAGDLLIPSSLKLNQEIEAVFEPAVDQPADWLHLTLRLEFEALVVSGSDVENLASGVMDANLETGYMPVANTLSFTHLSTPDKDGKLSWRVRAWRQTRAVFNEQKTIQQVLGMSPEQAQSHLASVLPLSAVPAITLEPGWWPRLPVIPFRIHLQAFQGEPEQ